MNISQNFPISYFNNTSTVKIQTEVQYYSELYENRPAKFVSISISLLLIIVSSLLAYTIIWYERYGTDNKRTLMNKLVSLKKTIYIGKCIKKIDRFESLIIFCLIKNNDVTFSHICHKN